MFWARTKPTSTRDLLRAEMIAIPITLILLVWVFGSVVAALLPLARREFWCGFVDRLALCYVRPRALDSGPARLAWQARLVARGQREHDPGAQAGL